MKHRFLRPRHRRVALTVVVIGASLSVGVGLGAAKPADVTLNITTWNPQSIDQLKPINDAFTAKYHVTVNFQALSPGSDYANLIGTRFASGNPPDVLFIQRGAGGSTLAASKQLLNLSNQPWISRLTPAGRSSASYNGTIYTMPLDVNFQDTVYYNTELFNKLGLNVPTSWSQFIAICQKLNAAGIVPLAMGGKDTWPLGTIDQNMIPADIRRYDPTFFAKRYAGKTTFSSSPAWHHFARDIILMGQDTIFHDPMATTWPDSVNEFVQGKAAMMIGGNWIAPVFNGTYGQATVPSFKVGDFVFPYLARHSPNDAFMAVTVGTQLAIAASTKQKKAAEEYLNFFASPPNLSKFITIYQGPTAGLSGAHATGLDPLVTNILKTGILSTKRTFGECLINSVPSNFYDTLRTDIGKAWSGQGMTVSQMLSDLDNAYNQGRPQMTKAYLC